MKVVNIADTVSEYSFSYCCPETIEVFASEYNDGGYDGSGFALILRTDKTVELYNMGHCSCYGPLEGGPIATWQSLNEFANCNDVTKGEYSSDLKEAFLLACN